MAELVHECEFDVKATSGRRYRPKVFAEQRGNVWVGWIEFSDRDGEVLRTAEETSQPTREAVEYWATGLELVYLQGALERAR